MPRECDTLARQAAPIERCPSCGHTPFDPFLYGQVQRSPFPWWTWLIPLGPLFVKERPYCSLICWGCKEIVGHVHPGTREVQMLRQYRKEAAE